MREAGPVARVELSKAQATVCRVDPTSGSRAGPLAALRLAEAASEAERRSPRATTTQRPAGTETQIRMPAVAAAVAAVGARTGPAPEAEPPTESGPQIDSDTSNKCYRNII